jgi:hypothetical protein
MPLDIKKSTPAVRKPTISSAAIIASTSEYIVVMAYKCTNTGLEPSGDEGFVLTLFKDGTVLHSIYDELKPGRPTKLGRGFYISPQQEQAKARLHAQGYRIAGTEN